MRDANFRERSNAVVRSIDWHPNAQLLLTGGLDKRLRLFNVDGVRNTCVQSVFLQDMPVANACFACGGDVIVAAGRRTHFYVWDVNSRSLERVPRVHGFDANSLESFAAPPAQQSRDAKACVAFLGNEGTVGIVSLLSRQLVGSVKMNGNVRCAAFDPAGLELYTGGTDGRVCVWDMRQQHRCLHSFVDEGCIRSTQLAVSATQVASASESGVVNVHNRWRKDAVGEWLGRPLRALENLVTSVHTLQFSPDGTMLCMASSMQKDAMRMVHIPTLSVYSNWPTSRTPLGHVHCASFSPDGGMLAVGNAKGHVLTYRLHQ
jgi:U3 small nucleolar RNA-associated protein 18